MSKKSKPDFNTYYSEIYGEDWPHLLEAMSREKECVELGQGLLKPYFLDYASTYPPLALGVKPGQRILDMCAAPGGKSLLLALALAGQGELVLNDLSRSRRNRLLKVMDECLPEEFRKTVKVIGKDSCYSKNFHGPLFDAILLDAPCSSERHLLDNHEELKGWSPSRTKSLAVRQMAMLCTALDLLKPGGELVYSTCSISPLENQNNIAKFLKKRKGKVEEVQCVDENELMGHRLKHGFMILPHAHDGAGPIYYIKLRKCLIECP
ncbi:MAG: RsmB/NOP family class I SAM-dependent RNA methyltransferase [Planctomycetes bacterium]|nr:RsmB/NOP family class I SAM-dependent RNA methyltransferase [Planctomycetota bacterium]